MVFLASGVKGYDRRCPLDIEISCYRLCIESHLQRYHPLIYKFDYLWIWVRNCTHLLASNSERVEKIKQDRLVLCFGSR